MTTDKQEFKVKSNNCTIFTTTDALEAHNYALDLADRTDEAVTVDPDPMHDLRDFASDFPVNFKLACGYTRAELPSYLLPAVDALVEEFEEWESKTLQLP